MVSVPNALGSGLAMLTASRFSEFTSARIKNKVVTQLQVECTDQKPT